MICALSLVNVDTDRELHPFSVTGRGNWSRIREASIIVVSSTPKGGCPEDVCEVRIRISAIVGEIPNLEDSNGNICTAIALSRPLKSHESHKFRKGIF